MHVKSSNTIMSINFTQKTQWDITIVISRYKSDLRGKYIYTYLY